MAKYNSCDFFMIRIPLLPIDDYLKMFNNPAELNLLLGESFGDPISKETLAIASKDLLEALKAADLAESSKSSNQVRSSLIKYFIRMSTRPTPFGLFSGISIGRFGDVSNIIVSDMANKIVEAFIKRSQSKTISGHKVTGWHYYPSAIEKSFMTAQAANGCVNYGVSHGMGGPLITLSMAYRNGARVEGLEEGINGIISEYMKASYRINDVVYWPGRTTLEQYAGQEEIRHTPNQMSWCYGSTGILRALYLSAVSISNEGLEGFAVDELLKIAQMQTAEYLLASPIVCHGFAGTAAIFNLMYRDTGKAEFLGKAMELAEICARIDIEHYFENARRTANQRNTPSRATLHDYLEGYSGILQSLLSIINKHPNENEKRLLIF